MYTLYGYILRELLKTLLLTIVAFTALFTMGGGLYNVIRFEGVAAVDILRFIPLFIPIVITVTLPMAALFAVTMVYGRLAADNEFTACRAAGINVHRLFIPAVVLSLAVGSFTLLVGNFVIPGLARRLGDYAVENLRDIVAQHLQTEGFVQYQEKKKKERGDRYTLTAERVQGVTDDALRERGFETGHGLHYLLVTTPTLLHVDRNGRLVRFTAAEQGLCFFDTRPNPARLTVFVREARSFDVGRQAVYVGQQQIGPIALPVAARVDLTTADLGALLRWRREPWAAPKMADEVANFLGKLAEGRFHAWCADALADGGTLVLADERDREYRITCSGLRSDDKGLLLENGRIARQERGADLPVRYEAEQVELRGHALPSGAMVVELNLVRTARQDVLEYEPRAGEYGAPRRKPTLSLDGTQVPADVLPRLRPYTAAQIVAGSGPLDLSDEQSQDRIGLQRGAAELRRKIAGTLHFRLGYTSCVLVILLMGAALGVMFRGSRALAAFALATIPFFSVLIIMMLGKQLAEDEVTQAIGPLVTWGGLAAFLLADLVVLRLGVRR